MESPDLGDTDHQMILNHRENRPDKSKKDSLYYVISEETQEESKMICDKMR